MYVHVHGTPLKMAMEKVLRFYFDLKYQHRNNLLLAVDCLNYWRSFLFYKSRSEVLLNGHFQTNVPALSKFLFQNTITEADNFKHGILWMAAPKKRTSRKTKWLRHQRKSIKQREDIEKCSVCGNAKLVNYLCSSCFERIQQNIEIISHSRE